MSLTDRIRPGDPLDADEVEQNFTDLDTLISPLTEARIERGAINTRHVASAALKVGEVKTDAGPYGGAGAFAATIMVENGGPSTYTTVSGEAYLVMGLCTATSAAANPRLILRIKVGGAAVITRTRDFPTTNTISFPIAWLAVAAGASTTIELEGEGSDVTVTDITLTVLAVRR